MTQLVMGVILGLAIGWLIGEWIRYKGWVK